MPAHPRTPAKPLDELTLEELRTGAIELDVVEIDGLRYDQADLYVCDDCGDLFADPSQMGTLPCCHDAEERRAEWDAHVAAERHWAIKQAI